MGRYRRYGYGMEITEMSLETLANGYITSKPHTDCIWASGVYDKYPWKQYVIDTVKIEGLSKKSQAVFEESYMEFDVEDDKIFHIHTLKDLRKYSKGLKRHYDLDGNATEKFHVIDFDKMRKAGYAGCEFHYSELLGTNANEHMRWDCDSVVIWDETVISNITYSPNYKTRCFANFSVFPEELRERFSHLYWEGDELF